MVSGPLPPDHLYDFMEEAEAGFKRHRSCSAKSIGTRQTADGSLGLTEISGITVDGSVIYLQPGLCKTKVET